MIKPIKLDFKYLAEVEAIYTFLSSESMNSGIKNYDSMINSICGDLELKFYKKLHSQSLRTITLKKHEALALFTLYTHVKHTNSYLIKHFNHIHQKLS